MLWLCVVDIVGSPDDVASLEIDFGDGATSYQASVDHTYLEPGRVFSGFAIVVDTRGQTTTQVGQDRMRRGL